MVTTIRAVDDPVALAKGARLVRIALRRKQDVERIVRETRAAQGLSPRITDPIALNKVVGLIRLPKTTDAARARGGDQNEHTERTSR